MAPAARRFRVIGRVQGVGFRWWVQRQGRDLALTGWVRNLPDGTVETVAAGNEAALERFKAALSQGPPGARVQRLEEIVLEESPRGDRFEIVD